jgi:type IV secretory pathway TraG/TraD family ATPase VirD4
MAGMTEVQTVSRSSSDNQGSPFRLHSGPIDAINHVLSGMGGGGGTQTSVSQQARRYMLPEELRELDNECLVFAEGVRGVIRAGRRSYFSTEEFQGRFDPDPYHVQRPVSAEE